MRNGAADGQAAFTEIEDLLTTSAIKTSFCTLAGDISLLSAEDIHLVGHVELVITDWPCQGMSIAGRID